MWDHVNEVLTTDLDVWSTDDAICNAAFRFGLPRNEIIDVREVASAADPNATNGASPSRDAPIATLSTEGTPIDNDAANQSAVTAALPITQAIKHRAGRAHNDAIARNMSVSAEGFQDMRETMTADFLRLMHTTGVSK